MPGEARGPCGASSTGALRPRPPTWSNPPPLPRQDTAHPCHGTGVAVAPSVHPAWYDRINCCCHRCRQWGRCQRGAVVTLTNATTTTKTTSTTRVAILLCALLMTISLQTPRAAKILFVLLLPPLACPRLPLPPRAPMILSRVLSMTISQ
jgi:hypothetical protein